MNKDDKIIVTRMFWFIAGILISIAVKLNLNVNLGDKTMSQMNTKIFMDANDWINK
jgi:hypothetical protein